MACRTKIVALLLVIVGASGCRHVQGRRTLTPLAAALPVSSARDHLPRLFSEGERPNADIIPVAQVSAAGNTYATRKDLEAKLIAEGADVGADCVIITREEVIKDQVVMHPRSGLIGLALSAANGTGDMSVISRPVLHGVAYRQATASLGAVIAPTGQVHYVRNESAAAKAGLEEGMKLLAVNDNFIQNDEYVLGREIFSKKPGDVVQLDVVTADSGKVRMAVMLEEPPQDVMLAADESSATPSPPPAPPSGS